MAEEKEGVTPETTHNIKQLFIPSKLPLQLLVAAKCFEDSFETGKKSKMPDQ